MSRQRVTLAAVAAAGLGLGGFIGCYMPEIQDGGLACANQGQKCPAGYECLQEHCWKTGGPGPDAGMMCGAPFPGCAPKPMTDQPCDPVCGSGCTTCGERCSLASGKATCTAGGTKKVYQNCKTGGGAEDCEAGLICIADDCGAKCYRFCRDDSQCPMKAHCALGITSSGKDTGYKICDVENNGCDPVGLAAGNVCPGKDVGVGCYVLAPDETGCDCSAAKPPVMEGKPCQFERECAPGLLCTTSAGSTVCRRVCNLGGPGTICTAVGKSCKSWMGSMKYGICE